jgi:hypothetical protein
LYASSIIIKVIKSREMRSAYKILVRKPKGKEPLSRPRHRREDNIRDRSYGNKVGRCGMDATSSS